MQVWEKKRSLKIILTQKCLKHANLPIWLHPYARSFELPSNIGGLPRPGRCPCGAKFCMCNPRLQSSRRDWVSHLAVHPPSRHSLSIHLSLRRSLSYFLSFYLSLLLSLFSFSLVLFYSLLLTNYFFISLYLLVILSLRLLSFSILYLRHGNSSKFHSFFSLIFPPLSLSLSLFLSSFLYFFLLSLSKFSK